MSEPRTRRFTVLMLAASVVGAAIRWTQIQVTRPTCPRITTTPQSGCFRIWGDAVYGYWQGQMISHGIWWKDPVAYHLDSVRSIREAAGKPPLYPGALGALGWWGGVAPLVVTIVLGIGIVALTWWIASKRCTMLGARLVTGAMVLALAWFGIGGATSTNQQRLALAACGVAVIGLMGSTARSIAGERCGVIVAFIAAVHPLLWINDGMLQVESLYALVIVWMIASALRWWATRSTWSMVELSAAVAVAAMLRAEAQLFAVALIVPLLLRAVDVEWRRRLVQLGVAVAVCAVAWAPWVAWNQTRFEQAPFGAMTVGTGAVLVSAYCDETYYGDALGYWAAHCFSWPITGTIRAGESTTQAADRLLGVSGLGAKVVAGGNVTVTGSQISIALDKAVLDESESDAVLRAHAVTYARAHLGRLPVVMAARILRTLDLYKPLDTLRINDQVEGRGELPSRIGLYLHWLLLPCAVGGVVVLWRRRHTVVPYVATAGVVLMTTAVTFGVTRYRIPLDLCEVLLAGVAIDALISRLRPGPPVEAEPVERMPLDVSL